MKSDSAETKDIRLGNKPLPWWTWVLPLFISNIGTWLSIWFKADPGTSLWYLPTALGIVMVYWWGPRTLLGLYLNAIFCTPLWGLPWQWSPLYALPETIEVGLSWFLLVRVAQGQYWLPNLRNVAQFLLLGSIIPAFMANLYLTTQLLLLGNIAQATFWDNWLILFSADLATHLVLAVPVLLLFTNFMSKEGWTQIESNITTLPLLPENRNSRYDIIFITLVFSSILIITILFSIHEFWILYGFLMIVLAIRYGVNMAVAGASWTGILVFLLPPILTGRLGVPTISYADFFTVNLEILFLCAVSLLTGRTVSDLYSEITDRKQAEIALQESQAFLHNIYTGVGMAIFVVDVAADGTFRYAGVNPAYEELVGLKSANLEGRTPEELIPIIGAEAAAEVRRNYEQCLQTNQIIYKENHVFWRGQEIWYLDQLTPIHDSEGRVIRIIGSTIDTTQIKQAEQALNRYADRLEILHEIDRAILAAHSPKEIARTALHYLRQLVPCQRIGLNLVDFETHEIVILAVEADNETQLKAGSSLAFKGLHHIIHELQQGRVFVHTDIELLPGGDVLLNEGIQSGISIPLIANEKLIGLVNLWTKSADGFSEEQGNIAREVADQLAIAIQQARLFEAEARRRREAEALQDIASVLNSTLNLAEVLDRILSNVGRVVQHNMVNIALIESGLTYVVRSQGYDQHWLGQRMLARHLVSNTPTLRQMAESGRPVIIPDTQADPRWIVKDEPWLRSYAGAPICLGGEVIGFLNLDSDIPGFFTPADAERLQVFADQAAVAIKNARLYAEAEQRAEHLAVLHELDRAITTSLDIDDVYQAFAQHTLRLLLCDHMSIGLVEGDSIHVVFQADEKRLELEKITLPLKTLAGANWVIEQGQPLLTEWRS